MAISRVDFFYKYTVPGGNKKNLSIGHKKKPYTLCKAKTFISIVTISTKPKLVSRLLHLILFFLLQDQTLLRHSL